MDSTHSQHLASEVGRRRTFAIISHPDAGKTTLTEKLLLYGGAIHLAGSVKQKRAASRATTSDWMEIERERGISISSSVLQFDHAGYRLNLLDTPGHNDFSEDTYRTLAAADSAVMLIDSVKGVEPQTIRLFRVCRMRHIPIVTFINKLDRYGRPPLELLDEIEKVLGIPATPVNWPIGSGHEFQGVYDRWRKQVLWFERAVGGATRAPMEVLDLDAPALAEQLGPAAHAQLREDLDLLEVAGVGFDRERFLGGQLTPVFFGSAMTNFGVQPFLEQFSALAPAPVRPGAAPDSTAGGGSTAHGPGGFSAFVFKIQANMDPHHRDRVAFVRICSGRFHRGMTVRHDRSGKQVTLNRPLQFLAQERAVVEEAYAGDIIGLWDPGLFKIGDVLCEGPAPELVPLPRFSPEHFVRVRLADPMKRKQLKKGLEQLAEEGAVQLFYDRGRLERDPVLGAVGPLQFDVIQYRLAREYGVNIDFSRLSFQHARWVEGPGFEPDRLEIPGRVAVLVDTEDRFLALFDSEFLLAAAMRDHPQLRFVAAVTAGAPAPPRD